MSQEDGGERPTSQDLPSGEDGSRQSNEPSSQPDGEKMPGGVMGAKKKRGRPSKDRKEEDFRYNVPCVKKKRS